MTFLNLNNPIRWLFLFHALAGAFALAVFLIPLLSKKGSRLHVRTGWAYTVAMVIVGVSSFILTPWRVFFDPERNANSITFSIFLGFIAIFTLTSLSYGLTTLKAKARKAPSRLLLHVGPPMATLAAGIATQIIGWKYGNVLLLAFPLLAHATAIKQLKYWNSPPQEKMHWWYAHMDGMFIACIATITAFLVTAVPRIWPGPFARSPILWIAPGVILGTILNRWTARYRLKFEQSSLAHK